MFRQWKFFTRFIRYCNIYIPNRCNIRSRRFSKIGQFHVLIGTQVMCAANMGDDHLKKPNSQTLEDDITKALEEGEAATLKLMTQLKDFVVVISEEYRRCIAKQIELMKQATYSSTGPFSQAWDDIPQHRSLANELKKELIDYCTLFNTLATMVNNTNSSNKVSVESKEHIEEFKELQHIVEKEIELNNKIEKDLLQAVTDNILHEVLFDTPDFSD